VQSSKPLCKKESTYLEELSFFPKVVFGSVRAQSVIAKESSQTGELKVSNPFHFSMKFPKYRKREFSVRRIESGST